jgi:hypothetical protein
MRNGPIGDSPGLSPADCLTDQEIQEEKIQIRSRRGWGNQEELSKPQSVTGIFVHILAENASGILA